MKKHNFRKIKIFLITGLLLSPLIASATTIDFAGQTWQIKKTDVGQTIEPGNNHWDDSTSSVFTDDKGLHLLIKNTNGQWTSSEIYLNNLLGYGQYIFDIDSPLDKIDPNLVAAPFLYYDDTHEIDIEYSYWTDTTTPNYPFLQYTAQPSTPRQITNDDHSDYNLTFTPNMTTRDIIDWQPDKINFSTEQNGSVMASWTYSGANLFSSITPAAVHINFWQINGLPPTNSSTNEFIIKNFSFLPYTAPISPTSTATTTIIDTTTPPNNNGNGSTPPPINQEISSAELNSVADKILNFLKSKQDNDGKIIDGGISDWTAMSFAAKGIYSDTIKNSDQSLYNYIYNYNFTDASDLNLCAAYPRHILALLASGVAKTDTKITDLKNKINTDCIKNNLYGESGINDDIFGLFALLALDENSNSSSTQIILNTIKSDQQSDGSFTWAGWPGADITGATINALKYAKTKGADVEENIFTKAKQYLKNTQLTDGGWGYGSSDGLTTGWAVMGINALGENQTNWFNSSGKNPWYILTNQLNSSGYYEPSWAPSTTDWFATKHAVPAILGKFWPIILEPIEPKTPPAPPNYGPPPPQIIPTSTPITTSTISIVTSTITTSPIEIKNDTKELLTTAQENIPTEILPKPIIQKTSIVAATLTPPTETPTLSALHAQNNPTVNLDNLPLDTPTKKTVKKILEISGGGAIVIGLYLGLRFIKTLV